MNFLKALREHLALMIVCWCMAIIFIFTGLVMPRRTLEALLNDAPPWK